MRCFSGPFRWVSGWKRAVVEEAEKMTVESSVNRKPHLRDLLLEAWSKEHQHGHHWELLGKCDISGPASIYRVRMHTLTTSSGDPWHFRVSEHSDAGECGYYPLHKGKILTCFSAGSNAVRSISLKERWQKGEGLTGGEWYRKKRNQLERYSWVQANKSSRSRGHRTE